MKNSVLYVWDQKPADNDPNKLLVFAKRDEFVTAGKFDGNSYQYNEANGHLTVRRTFVDEAAATEWATFIQGLGPVILSVTTVE